MIANITIVFPTFNRGKLLLNTIKKMEQESFNNVEVLVLDNASENYTKEYKEIKNISLRKKWLKYIRHQKNRGFEGNILAGFDNCNTNYLMFISDEDYPNFGFLEKHQNLFNNARIYGAIRPSIGLDGESESRKPINAFTYPDEYFKKGVSAIGRFGLTGNYLSGVIYNKVIFDKYGFRERLASNLGIQRFYPHLYLNCLFCAVSRTIFMKDASAFEGIPEIVEIDGIKQNDSSSYRGAYTFGARLDQFIALRNAISEALELGNFNDPLDLLNLYLNLVAKFFHLIVLANGRLYHNQHKIHVINIAKSFTEFATSSIRLYPAFQNNEEKIVKRIEELEKSFLDRIAFKSN